MTTYVGGIDGGGSTFKPVIYDPNASIYDPRTRTYDPSRRIIERLDPIPTPTTLDQYEFVEALRPAIEFFAAHGVRGVGLLAPPVPHYRRANEKLAPLPYGVHHPKFMPQLRLPDLHERDHNIYCLGGPAVPIRSMTNVDAPFDFRSKFEAAMQAETGRKTPTFITKETVGNLYAEQGVGVGLQMGWQTFVMIIDGTGFGIGAVKDGDIVPRDQTFVLDLDGNLVSPTMLRRLGQVVTVQEESAGRAVPATYGDLTMAGEAIRVRAAREIATKQAFALRRLNPDLGHNYVLTGTTPTRLLREEMPSAYEHALAAYEIDANVVVSPLGENVGLTGAGEVAARGLERLRALEHGIA
jgi:hypothetical protein